MNVTELARILKISPQELRDKLPLLGFDIGQKAIKVDNQIATRIIREWPILVKKLNDLRQGQELKKDEIEAAAQVKKEIFVPAFLTVRDFSILTGLPINKVLTELMKSGIFSSINEKIDFDTAAIIGSDLGLEIKLKDTPEAVDSEPDKLKKILGLETEADLKPRPPVIVVMGHVDHGKTKLLDAIRKTDVVASEAGGITQHIGAYQISHKDKIITFIDTPGHEAFTAMRNRGAKVADIAILVVAADDGVKPQTVEAYRIIEAAKIPFLVAINKIDKPEANLDKTKQELSNQLNILPEDWGGKIIMAPISAKENKGIQELLDMLLLLADMESQNIKANPGASASGTIVESHVDKGEGPVATVLVQNGTLRVHDQLSFNNQDYGKVRALKDYRGQNVNAATPAMPVKIIGLKIAPQVGDILQVGRGEKMKSKYMKSPEAKHVKTEAEEKAELNIKKINLIIKSDVLGSGEAIEGSLAKIDLPLIKINIVSKGLGNITEGDVGRAQASSAKILGFNVKVLPLAMKLAREKSVKVKLYKIIYDLINDIKNEAEGLIEPEIIRTELGRVKVLAIFRTLNSGQIIGGKVLDGQVESGSQVDIMREKEKIDSGKLARLQAGKQDVTSVPAGQECGIEYQGKPLIQVGDILDVYKEEKIIRKN